MFVEKGQKLAKRHLKLYQLNKPIFAEAIEMYQAGEDWWTIPTEMAKDEQDQRKPEDPWQSAILKYLVEPDSKSIV